MWVRAAILVLGLLLAGGMSLIAKAEPMPNSGAVPIVIGHRGASGERPEHTLASYERAIDQGADFIEPDLVMTKDGHLVARHENEISETTDVARHPEFADRKRTQTIDGQELTGWFTEDFTLAELRTLRAKERLAPLRPANTRFDGLYQVPTLEEIIALVRAKEAETGRTIGLYPETKHPSHFVKLGMDMDRALVDALAAAGYEGADAPVFIQSFELGNLKHLHEISNLRLIFLVSGEGEYPPDMPDMPYAKIMTPAGLAEIATFAQGIGPAKDWVIPRKPDGTLGEPTGLVAMVHDAGMQIHIWTFRRENYFLPEGLKGEGTPADPGDMAAEVAAYLAAGVDGLFSDNPREAVAARDAFLAGR